jgi:hypothetical protein
MAAFYQQMVEDAAERAADNDGIVDLVDTARAAEAGFDTTTFIRDVEREARSVSRLTSE